MPGGHVGQRRPIARMTDDERFVGGAEKSLHPHRCRRGRCSGATRNSSRPSWFAENVDPRQGNPEPGMGENPVCNRYRARSWLPSRDITLRITTRSLARWASCGKCSVNESPGTVVAMARRRNNRRGSWAWGRRCRFDSDLRQGPGRSGGVAGRSPWRRTAVAVAGWSRPGPPSPSARKSPASHHWMFLFRQHVPS